MQYAKAVAQIEEDAIDETYGLPPVRSIKEMRKKKKKEKAKAAKPVVKVVETIAEKPATKVPSGGAI